MIEIHGRHIRAARALLGWTQEELAARAKVALGTIKRMESLDGPVAARTDTLREVVAALEKAGIEFLNCERPRVRMNTPAAKKH